jgi:hypothetical protein
MKTKKVTISAKRIFPHIRKLTWEETREAGLWNPGLILEYCDLQIPLSAGYLDSVLVFLYGICLMILSVNRQLEYVGLDEVGCLDGGIIGSVFLEGSYIVEAIGNRWLQMKPETLVKRLSEYL